MITGSDGSKCRGVEASDASDFILLDERKPEI